MTNLIFGIVFCVFDTAVFLYYAITFWKKIRTEKKLLQEASTIYKNRGWWNFIWQMSFLYIPILFFVTIILFILAKLLIKEDDEIMIGSAYALYTVLILIYIIALSAVGDNLLIFIYKDNVVLMSCVIKKDRVAAIDFNSTKKHVYLNYIDDVGGKAMIKLHNKKPLLQWLEANFDKQLFVY